MGNSQTKIDFLIIEDDFNTVKLLKLFVESNGHTCKVAGSVKKGLKILKNKRSN